MKKFFNYILIVLGVIAVAIQFYPVERTNPPVGSELKTPVEVNQILRRSCYDCHSNETHWPWYSRVAPVSWLVAYDVEEGRAELNFSEWDKVRDPNHMIEEIVEEVVEGEMPLAIYTFIHPKSKLTAEEMDTLKSWGKRYGDD